MFLEHLELKVLNSFVGGIFIFSGIAKKGCSFLGCKDVISLSKLILSLKKTCKVCIYLVLPTLLAFLP